MTESTETFEYEPHKAYYDDTRECWYIKVKSGKRCRVAVGRSVKPGVGNFDFVEPMAAVIAAA